MKISLQKMRSLFSTYGRSSSGNSASSSYACDEDDGVNPASSYSTSSQRDSLPAVLCTPPSTRDPIFKKRSSAPRSSAAALAAPSQVGKMSPLARYGSLRQVGQKKEQQQDLAAEVQIQQFSTGVIARCHSHINVSQTCYEDQEEESDDDDTSCFGPHSQCHIHTQNNEESETLKQKSKPHTKETNAAFHISNSLEVPSDFSGGGSSKESKPPPHLLGTTSPITMAPRRHSSIPLRSPAKMNIAEMLVACAAEAVEKPVMSGNRARSRSYLLGSCGRTSLLAEDEFERYLPDRNIRVFVGTWNMNGENPPRHLSDFLLPQRVNLVPDVLVIGSQESYPERVEWEVRLQETLGPSHVLYHSAVLGTLHLAIFLRRDLIWFCSMPDVDSFSTRPGSQFKTKGAVAVGFTLFGTSFLFVNSHLTAHEENTSHRIKDLKTLNAVLDLPKVLKTSKGTHRSCRFSKSCDFTDNFDVVFWCGDLNFRLEQDRDIVMHELSLAVNRMGDTSGCFDSVLDFDQLNHLRSEGLIFKDYKEDPISFPPTFKYDTGTNEFDTSSKQRVPSYTDRILYKARRGCGCSSGMHLRSRKIKNHKWQQQKIKPLHYHSVQNVITSDHKPVWGMWEVDIKPGKDSSVPLSGGLFNREVYLEGLKRRSEALQLPG